MEQDVTFSTTEVKIKKEMKLFMALTVMSIAFGGIALAFAITTLTTNGLALKTTDPTMLINSITNIGISFIVACLALWFIISTAEVLGKFVELQEDTADETNLPSENLTQHIIKLIGLYREEKPQIKRMILVSKIAGICFFAYALFQTIMVFFNPPIGSVALITAVGGILTNVIMGLVGFFLPFSFHKYTICWDERLLKSNDVEQKILSFMEGHL